MVTGGRLTDVADAYLLDPTVAERVVVVSSLGTSSNEGARMGVPNGETDRWADFIVAERFRYVQVSAYYDQVGDVPAERLAELPMNPFGDFLRGKQPQIFDLALAADQVAPLALGVPAFVRNVTRVSTSGWDGEVLVLSPNPAGNVWLVGASDPEVPRARLWELLGDPRTFGN